MPWEKPQKPTPVRAKFYVQEISLFGWATQIKMNVVTKGEENKEWAAATPVGTISMNVKNEHAAEQFWPGQEWELLFTPVPEASDQA